MSIGAICAAQPRIAAMPDALLIFSPLGRAWVRDGFQEFPSQAWVRLFFLFPCHAD